MEDILKLGFIPVIGIVIGLIIEYFIIQPIKKATERAIPSSPSISKDWSTAMKKAIGQFRSQYYGHIGQWLPRPHESVTIDEWDIEKGRATLTLAINKMLETFEPGILGFFRIPRVIAKHKLTIDRTGDILEIKSIPVDLSQTGYSSRTPPSPLREMTLTIKNWQARREKVNNGVNAVIEFEVENSGKAGKICPYIEFEVVTTELDGNYTPKKWHTKPKPVDIPALCVKPFRYSLFFQSPDLPLVEPPHEVKIELRTYPDTRNS
jgi:hypothetical protein